MTFQKYAVISCGKGNKFGHPTEATLNTLNSFNANILRTDLSGSIKIEVKKGIIFVNNKAKTIDIAIVCSVASVLILVIWALPDGKKNKPKQKDIKK